MLKYAFEIYFQAQEVLYWFNIFCFSIPMVKKLNARANIFFKSYVCHIALVAIVTWMENCSTTVYEDFLQVDLRSTFHQKNLANAEPWLVKGNGHRQLEKTSHRQWCYSSPFMWLLLPPPLYKIDLFANQLLYIAVTLDQTSVGSNSHMNGEL